MQPSMVLQGDKAIIFVAVATTMLTTVLLTMRKMSKKETASKKEKEEDQTKSLEAAPVTPPTPTKVAIEEDATPSEVDTSYCSSEGSDSGVSEPVPAEPTETPISPRTRKSFMKRLSGLKKSGSKRSLRQVLSGLKRVGSRKALTM